MPIQTGQMLICYINLRIRIMPVLVGQRKEQIVKGKRLHLLFLERTSFHLRLDVLIIFKVAILMVSIILVVG